MGFTENVKFKSSLEARTYYVIYIMCTCRYAYGTMEIAVCIVCIYFLATASEVHNYSNDQPPTTK